jgi:hypothetical protein
MTRCPKQGVTGKVGPRSLSFFIPSNVDTFIDSFLIRPLHFITSFGKLQMTLVLDVLWIYALLDEKLS